MEVLMKITICGSMLFLPEMGEIKSVLESQGHRVAIPFATPEEKVVEGNYIKPWMKDDGKLRDLPGDDEVWQIKYNSIVGYFDEVKNADIILVANYEKRGVSGYVGGNTLMEIGIALSEGKPIYMLFPPNTTDVTYGEELMGSLPIVLNGDLNLIAKACAIG